MADHDAVGLRPERPVSVLINAPHGSCQPRIRCLGELSEGGRWRYDFPDVDQATRGILVPGNAGGIIAPLGRL